MNENLSPENLSPENLSTADPGTENPTVVFARPLEVVIEKRPVPATASGEVLIKTSHTLISTGTELTILSGEFPPDSAWSRYGRFPFVAGYVNIGEVIDVHPDVSREWIGQRVASSTPHARYVTASAQSLQPVNPDISNQEAAFFALSHVVMNSVRRANVGWGEAVVIFGVGLLGQLAVRFCRLCGARPVIAVDVADSRLQSLPRHPAIIPINPLYNDVVDEVKKATKGRMADVAFEVTGNPKLVVDEFKVLRRQGRFVFLSSPRGSTQFDFHDLCNSPSFTIIGTHNSSHPQTATLDNPWTSKRHIEFFFDLVSDGELPLASLVSHREPYTEAPRVYQMLLEDRSEAMGVLLEW